MNYLVHAGRDWRVERSMHCSKSLKFGKAIISAVMESRATITRSKSYHDRYRNSIPCLPSITFQRFHLSSCSKSRVVSIIRSGRRGGSGCGSIVSNSFSGRTFMVFGAPANGKRALVPTSFLGAYRHLSRHRHDTQDVPSISGPHE
jgi:hypothetical protein